MEPAAAQACVNAGLRRSDYLSENDPGRPVADQGRPHRSEAPSALGACQRRAEHGFDVPLHDARPRHRIAAEAGVRPDISLELGLRAPSSAWPHAAVLDKRFRNLRGLAAEDEFDDEHDVRRIEVAKKTGVMQHGEKGITP